MTSLLGGAEYPHGDDGDDPMNDSYHSDLGELGTGPVTPGGPFRPQGCVGVEATPFSGGDQDVIFAVETVLGASTPTLNRWVCWSSMMR